MKDQLHQFHPEPVLFLSYWDSSRLEENTIF